MSRPPNCGSSLQTRPKAGLKLATNDHKVPTLVISTTDPLAAGIIKSVDDSGLNHVHARVDPYRHKRQIRLFHDIIGFGALPLLL